jgi:ElaB/YqjD/DUF883 family membrane-anchored ribosome-binding protein
MSDVSSASGTAAAAQDANGSSPDGSGDQIQEKARDAAGQAQDTVRQQVDQQAKKAAERISGTADDLRSVGEELRKQGKDGPAKLADRAAEQTEKVGSYLSGAGPDQMLHDAEDFGRERPWALLGGGLVLGAVAARFLKASSRGRYQERSRARGSANGRQIASPSATQPPSPPRESAEPMRASSAAIGSPVGGP